MDPNFSWIYLVIFLAIPLARIIPRMLARRRVEGRTHEVEPERYFDQGFGRMRDRQEKDQTQQPEKYFDQGFGRMRDRQEKDQTPQSKDRLVLGELNRGAKTFEGIQRQTGLDGKDLDKVLSELEKKGMMRVEHKQGLFGPKVELYPTEKGFKEYYS